MGKIEFGFHASAGGKIEKLPQKVDDLGGECFQFFSRNPYGGQVKDWEKEKLNKFFIEIKKFGISNYFIHAPYFINLASKNERIFSNSIEALKIDLRRMEKIKGNFVVTHLGSAKDFIGEPNAENLARERISEGLCRIIGNRLKVPLLLEIASGAGAIMGSNLEEIEFFLKRFPQLGGFCLDTAHAFASGYDIRSEKKLNLFFADLDQKIGLDKLKLVHFNDSGGKIGSKIDRHRHLGEGEIGLEAFERIVDYFKGRDYNVSIILETPTEEGLKRDLALLKKFRAKK